MHTENGLMVTSYDVARTCSPRAHGKRLRMTQHAACDGTASARTRCCRNCQWCSVQFSASRFTQPPQECCHVCPVHVLYQPPVPRQVDPRVLEECGATYDVVPVAYADPQVPAGTLTTRSAEFLAINPMGKLPALKAGDTVLTETLAIGVWLAEQFPEKHLTPAAGSPERGEFYRWMCFSLHLEYAIFDRVAEVPSSEARRKGIGYGDFDTAFNTLRAHLKDREYMVGNQMTILDLYYAMLLARFTKFQPVLPADDPVLVPYMERFMALPSFARAMQLDEVLAQQMGA